MMFLMFVSPTVSLVKVFLVICLSGEGVFLVICLSGEGILVICPSGEGVFFNDLSLW